MTMQLKFTHTGVVLGLMFSFAQLSSFSVLAQAVKMEHKDEFIRIKSGTDFYLNGKLQQNASATKIILNQSDLYITDSIINKGNLFIFGTLPDTLGKVILQSKDTSIGIIGNGIYFSNLEIDKSNSTIYLDLDTLFTTCNLKMTGGKINLNKRHIYLRRTNYGAKVHLGLLQNENNDNHVYGIYPGYVKLYRPLLLSQTYSNLQGIGLDLSVDGNLGSRTEVRRFSEEQAGASNGSVLRYYELIPQIVDQVSNVAISYLPVPELNGNSKEELRFYLSQDGGLSWRDQGGTSDTTNDKVSTNSMTQFFLPKKSRFTLSEDSCDVLPYVNIRQDTFPLCSGQSIYLPADSVGDLEVYWSNNVSNVDSILVNSPGTYWVKVTSDGGCVNFDSCVVIQAPDPEPGFFAAPHCVADSAFFNDTSKIASGTITYNWDFGDPFSTDDTSSLKTPKYLYTKYGTFNATVEVTSNYGCKKSISRAVTVLPFPDVKFTTSNVCADSTTAFANTTTIPGGSGISYKWFFGDGDTSVASSPTHTYQKDTTFQVQLIAGSFGCVDTVTKPVTIYPNPEAKFVFNNSCPGELVQFTDSSSINTGSITYQYDLGNTVTSVLASPSTTYSSNGNYTVSLNLTSDKNCKASFKDTVVVHPIPSANFTVGNACVSDSTSFTNSSTISSGTYASFWTFGDGNTSIISQPKHAYASSGSFIAKLRLVSDSGCTDSTTKSISAYPNPVANFTMSKACEGDVVNFTNSSSLLSGSLGYKWYFGNGDTSISKTPSTSYSTSGAINVLLVASSANSCVDSLTKSLTVNAKPIVSLGTTVTTCGSSLELDAGNTGSTFFWNNGKNTQKITVTVSNSYSVNVTNAQQCSQKDTVSVVLNSAVTPNLGPDQTVCDSVVLSSGYGATASTVLWSGGSVNHDLNVNTTGTYFVQVTDPNNCVGSDTIFVTVNTSPSLNLGNDIVACSDSNLTLISNISVPTYKWSTGATTNQISPTKSGEYRLTVTDANSCKDVDTVNVSFNATPLFNLGADREVCDSTTLNISITGVTVQWKGGSSTSDFLVSQSDTIWAVATSGQGCEYSDTAAITVNTSPIVDLGQDTALCFGGTYQLDAGYPSSSYQWSTPDTTQLVTIGSSQYILVTVTDTNQCLGEDSISVTIQPLFVVDLGADEPLCLNSTKQVSPGIQNGKYNWAGSNGFASTDSAVVLSDTGIYWVKIEDTLGCLALDTIQMLYTDKEIRADFTAVDEILTGDTVAFINLSYPTPDNHLWIMHDGYTSRSKHVLYPYFIQGEYEVKLAVSNSQCSDTISKKINVKLRTRNEVYENTDLTKFIEIVDLKLFPNPTRDFINVELELSGKGEVIVEMFDMFGHLHHIESLQGSTFKRQYYISEKSPGMFFIRTTTGKSSRTKKFIKVN